MTLTPLIFDLILIVGQGTVMNYPCAKFGDFSFSRFGFVMRTETQNHRHTDRITELMQMIAILTRLQSACVNSLCENYVNFGATFMCILIVSSYVRNVCMPYVLNLGLLLNAHM